MKIRNKAAAVLVALMFVGQAPANADFTGDFAVPNWTYSETDTSASGPTNSLTSTLMSITSADWSTGAVTGTKGSYSITIPWNIGLITFDYEYTTIDRDNSSFDMATYTLGGEETDLVASDIPKFGSESGTKTLNTTGLGGTTLSINQKCTDCVLGTATVRITGFRGTPFRESNQLLVKSPATLSMGASSYTCKPGAFTFLNRGVTSEAGAPTSLIYSLILDGVRVSAVSSDNFVTMGKYMVGATTGSVTGTASLESATWTVTGAGAKAAQCEILAYQDHATTSTTSNGL
jgi:hypothetical protein